MNIWLVVLLGWAGIGLETGLKETLTLRLGSVVAQPSFVIPLAAFIALCAPPAQVLWACMALGVVLDLTAPRPTAAGSLTVLGPYAIGLMLAGWFVLLVRGLVIRRNPLTLVVVSVLASLICHIWVTAIFTARRIIDSADWHATSELLSRVCSSLLTGGSALVLALVLLPLAPMLGLHTGHARNWR